MPSMGAEYMRRYRKQRAIYEQQEREMQQKRATEVKAAFAAAERTAKAVRAHAKTPAATLSPELVEFVQKLYRLFWAVEIDPIHDGAEGGYLVVPLDLIDELWPTPDEPPDLAA